MRVLVLDLDHSLVEQPVFAALLDRAEATLVPARDLARKLRIVANRSAWDGLRFRLERVGLGRINETPLIFYGSGDFHHLSTLFLSRLDATVSVIQFDNHPDWVRFPATHNCGGWVSRALELPQVSRIVTIGPSSDDFLRPQMKFANLRAIRDGQLEVHPWRAKPSFMWGKPIHSPGCHTEGHRLIWNNLADRSWGSFVNDLDDRLPKTALWITLDKDVLSPDEAVTNWDQGSVKLDQIFQAIAQLGRRRPIAGMDVCGDYSPPVFRDAWRTTLSLFDRSGLPTPTADALAINGRTNRRIVEYAREIFR